MVQGVIIAMPDDYSWDCSNQEFMNIGHELFISNILVCAIC